MTHADEYNTRLWAPGYAATMARHAALGAPVRARPEARLGLRWGAGERQTVDLFLPTVQGAPLVLFIHGGYWQYKASGPQGASFLAPAFLDAGCAFAAISYELCPDVTMDGMVEQIRRAVAWLAGSAVVYGYSTARLTAIGHSAGAHLAAMMALTRWERHGQRRDLVTGAVGVSGIYDLRPLVGIYLNDALRMDEATAWRNSPMRHVRPDAPEMVVAAGAAESRSFKLQSAQFAAACAEAGSAAACLELAARDHYEAIEDLVVPGHPLHRAALRLATGTE